MLPGSWLCLILDTYHVCSDTIIYLFFEIYIGLLQKVEGLLVARQPVGLCCNLELGLSKCIENVTPANSARTGDMLSAA